MLDLLGLLMAPRVYLGALTGAVGGVGLAILIRYLVGARVPIELLAAFVAISIVAGVLAGAWHRGTPTKE